MNLVTAIQKKKAENEIKDKKLELFKAEVFQRIISDLDAVMNQLKTADKDNEYYLNRIERFGTQYEYTFRNRKSGASIVLIVELSTTGIVPIVQIAIHGGQQFNVTGLEDPEAVALGWDQVSVQLESQIAERIA